MRYALCNDRRTLLWFANQRAVEYHPALVRAGSWNQPTHLVLDLDPPATEDAFARAVRAAGLVRQTLADIGLAGAVKTSGAKGLHVFVPLADATAVDVAAAGRALALRAERLAPDLATTAFMKEDRGGRVFLDSTRTGGATMVAAYSPRITARCTSTFACTFNSPMVNEWGFSVASISLSMPSMSNHDFATASCNSTNGMPASEGPGRTAPPADTGRARASNARGQAPRPRPPILDFSRWCAARSASGRTSVTRCTPETHPSIWQRPRTSPT